MEKNIKYITYTKKCEIFEQKKKIKKVYAFKKLYLRITVEIKKKRDIVYD